MSSTKIVEVEFQGLIQGHQEKQLIGLAADISYGALLSHGGTPCTPSHHPFLYAIFHEINHPAIGGTPPMTQDPPHMDQYGFVIVIPWGYTRW